MPDTYQGRWAEPERGFGAAAPHIVVTDSTQRTVEDVAVTAPVPVLHKR
jgi:hypothetical protein